MKYDQKWDQNHNLDNFRFLRVFFLQPIIYHPPPHMSYEKIKVVMYSLAKYP